MGKRNSETAKNLPDDLYEKLKTPPHETQGERKKRVQRITREWAERWFRYESLDAHHEEMFVVNPPLKVLSVKSRPPPSPGVNPHPSTLKTHDDFSEAYQRYLKRTTHLAKNLARDLTASVQISQLAVPQPSRPQPVTKLRKKSGIKTTTGPQAPSSSCQRT